MLPKVSILALVARRHANGKLFSIFVTSCNLVLHQELAIAPEVLRGFRPEICMATYSHCECEIFSVLTKDVCVLVVAFADLCVHNRHMRCDEDLSHLMDAIESTQYQNEDC